VGRAAQSSHPFFEAWAIKVLSACRSIADGCRLLRLKWDAADRIMERAVQRGLARREIDGLRLVGLDEKSFGKGQDYISLMTDLAEARVLEVTPGHDTQSGCALWQALPQEQRAQVQAAAMDMSAGFAAATRTQAPQAAIVHDKFHVSKLLNEAVDKVRRREHRELQEQDDDRLCGTRQLWLYNPVNLSDPRLEDFQQVLKENLKTSRAWLHKENFQGFWQQESAWAAEGYFRRWYAGAIRSRLEPIKKVARSLKTHLAALLNYFTWPITNAVTEGLNSKIQQLKAAARGFRSFANYRTRILFFCGKLDLLPPLPGCRSAF
jgi:transposase